MRKLPAFRRSARGFSLVELMVAMSLSLVLLAGALSILYTSRLTYTENERLARVQEAGRTTLEMILRDVRASGFAGCSRIQPANFTNVLNNSNGLLWDFSRPIFGFEANAGAWTPALDAALMPLATVGSDVLVIRTSRLGSPVMRINAPTTDPTQPINVDMRSNATVAAGTTLVISDCEFATVFNASGTFGGAATANVPHVQNLGVEPGNIANSIVTDYPIDSLIQQIDTVIYYVRPSATPDPITGQPRPALWLRIGNTAPVELIQGIENLQVLYGIDTDNDLLVDQYSAADVVQGPPVRWGSVVSVSIAVLVRSDVDAGVETDTRTYNLLGTNLGPFNDRRQRSVFTTTVTLRNGST
jgi:type IV pilus assembly protein PilW